MKHTDERLMGGSGAAASPFVIALSDAKIKGLDRKFCVIIWFTFSYTSFNLDLVNVTICISVLSIGLSCVYAGSRTLVALAETGYAPKGLAYGMLLYLPYLSLFSHLNICHSW